jgi:hypothetical protein
VSELAWGWAEIAITLMWRLAPKGLVLLPKDLDLPRDRVLLEDRQPGYIRLSFISLRDAHARTHAPSDQASTDQIAGRWQMITAVLLWKLAKQGVHLTESDRAAVPKELELLTSGHPDGVEWRFIPRLEARAMHAKARDNEGKIITEGNYDQKSSTG